MKPITSSTTLLLLALLTAPFTSATPVSQSIHPIRAAEPQNLGRYVCPPGVPRGSLACTTETSYVICSDWAEGSIVMPVAAGTVCRDNRIIPAAPFVPAAKADDPKKPAAVPSPTPTPVDSRPAPRKPTVIASKGNVVILPID